MPKTEVKTDAAVPNFLERATDLALKWKAMPAPIGGQVCLMSRRDKIEGILVISPFDFPLARLHDIVIAANYSKLLMKNVAVEFADGSVLKLEQDSFSDELMRAYPKGVKDLVAYVALEVKGP